MDYFLKNMLLTMENKDDFKSKFKFNDAEYIKCFGGLHFKIW